MPNFYPFPTNPNFIFHISKLNKGKPIIINPKLIPSNLHFLCSSSTHLSPPSNDHIAQLILDQKSPHQVIQTFKWASKLPNFTHNQSTYRALVHKLCVFRRFDNAHHLLDEMPSSIGSAPDDGIFVTLVRGLGRARRVREVIKVPELARKFGLVPSLKIYNSILDVLVKEDIDIARGFFRKKMMECGVEGDDYTFGILMKGLCLTNRIGDGFKLLELMKTRGLRPNVVVYNTLLHALCKNGKVGRARSLMSGMEEVNDVTYNLLISAYCKEGNVVQAQVLLEKCFAAGFVPDVVTTTKVMEFLCNLGCASEAAEVLERVGGNGGVVDVVAYNTLIRGFCGMGKAKVGLHFKKDMENRGFLPNVDTYNILISGFCDIDLLDVALDLFNEMKRVAINCDFVTYDTLIRGCCSKGLVEDGYKILELMEDSKGGSKGHISPYNNIIYGLYLENRWNEALGFLNKISIMFPRAVERTLKILSFCEQGSIECAKQVYDQMLLEGGSPSVLVYSCLIHAFSTHNDVRAAFQLMNQMVGCGYFPVVSTYNAVIKGFCKQGKVASALQLTEEMEERGFLLDVGSYSPLIHALYSRGDLQRVLKTFWKMVDKGITPDPSTWNSVVCCLNQETKWLESDNICHLDNRIQLIVKP